MERTNCPSRPGDGSVSISKLNLIVVSPWFFLVGHFMYYVSSSWISSIKLVVMDSELQLQFNHDVSGSASRGSTEGAVFDGLPFELGAVFPGRVIASSRKARRAAAA